jgi:hypothetical protein
VRRPDVLRRGQVGDGASELEHAVVGARREVQLAQAACIRRWPASSSWQCSRTSAAPTSALVRRCVPLKRLVCMARAAATRSRTAWDGSPCRVPDSFSQLARGTSTWMSVRSSSGPEMRFCSRGTTEAEHVQFFSLSPW